MSDNTTITGNLTRDPELRFTPSGQATANFGIAVNRRWRDRSGEWQDKASFFDVVVWREQAENCAESLTRGDRVIVTGRLESRTWESEDGRKGTKIEIVADEIAPSLRWSTCEVTKNERRDSGAARSSSAPADDSEPF